MAEGAAAVPEQLGRGIATGIVDLGQGLTEMATAGLDLAFGTSTSRPTTEFFNNVKSYTAPTDTTGEVFRTLTSGVLAFLPVAGWLGRASWAAKTLNAGKSFVSSASLFLKSAEEFGTSSAGRALLGTKTGLIGTTALGTGAAETIFAPDGRVTISDAFDLGGPLMSEPDTGLGGREEALRRVRNKLRFGAEGAAASLVFDAGLAGIAKGVGAVGKTDAAAAVARGIRTGYDVLGSAVSKIPGAKTIGNLGVKYLTPSGGADPRVFEGMMDTVARIDATEAGGIKAYQEFQTSLSNTIGKMRLWGKGKQKVRAAERDLYSFLTGVGPRLDKYGPEVATAADRLLDVSNNVRKNFIESVETELKTAIPGTDRAIKLQNALDLMRDHQAAELGFLRRSFAVHKDPFSYYKSLNLAGKDKQLYDDATREVARNLFGDEAGTVEAMSLARYKVNEYMGLGAINNGLSPKAAIGKLLGSLKEQQINPQSGLFARTSPRLKITPTLVTPRESILDVSPKLRQLLGEVKDPKQLYLQTIGDMTKTTEALNFYRNLTGVNSGMVSSLADAVPNLSKGIRPTFVKVPDPTDLTGFDIGPFMARAQELNKLTTPPKAASMLGAPAEFAGNVQMQDIIASYTDELVQSGYIKLGEADNLSDVFVGQYGGLSGIYVSPETYQALSTPLRIGITGIDEVLSVLTQIRGLSQKMTIVPNPETQVRNIIGNLLMLGATGNLSRSTDVFDVFKLFTSSLKDVSDQGLDRLAKTISLSGATESSLVVKALQEYRDAGASLTVSGKLRNGIETAEKFVPFLRMFEKLYANSDSFFKGVAVVSEQQKLMKAFSDAGLKEPVMFAGKYGLLSETELLLELQSQGLAKRLSSSANPELSPLEVISADAVKDMFPIYNRVGLAIRALDKFPIFGNFMSFASENIRNSINILDRGLKEMSFTVSPAVRQNVGEDIARAFERSIRAQGAQRLTAYTAVAGVLPKSAVKASMMATGTTPQEMEAMYSQLPDFYAGNDIVITSNDHKGKIEYINMGYTMPYAFAIDPATAGLRAYNEAGRLGKDTMSQIANGVWASVTSYADPFASQSMSSERVLDVLPRELLGRGGITLTGARVYSDSDTLSVKALSSINHLMATYIPGYAREIVEVRGGDVRPGRITRAMFNIPGPQGEEFNLPSEFARVVTGFTPLELNLRRDFQFSGKEYSPLRQDAKTSATRIIRAPDRTEGEMVSAWETYLSNLKREQTKLYGDIQAARTLGLSDKEIRRQLITEAQLGAAEVTSIMRGKFYPGLATSELIKEIRLQERYDKINRVTPASEIPVRELNRMSSDLRGDALILDGPASTPARKVLPQAPAAPVDLGPFGSRPTPSAPVDLGPFGVRPAPAPAPAPAPQQQGSIAPAAPQAPQAPIQRAAISPSLLGGDLASRSANMEIAQRLGSTG